MPQTIGILTAGGDSPGLNAAIRAVGKSAQRAHGMHVIGFRDGFRGLMQNRSVRLDTDELSGILTKGGTVLGTSREKVHKVDVGNGNPLDMRPMIKRVVEEHNLTALVCLGGGGTQKNALRLWEQGIPVMTLPKTIDNDVWGTDISFGYDTALNIATEAVDRLHSTAHSHHRIMVMEVMGHNAGWLALGAGLAGGADVILLPEIPYEVEAVAESIMQRKAAGSSFSIVVVSEGAMSHEERAEYEELRQAVDEADTDDGDLHARQSLAKFVEARSRSTEEMADRLESLTGLEARVTILGHVQRGGTPSPLDRVLATRLGTAATDAIADGKVGVMIAARGEEAVAVSIEEVAGKRKTVPPDHSWITSARRLGTNLGD
ncbi:MAG TPA: ATP-dependent 6-phosphofructokinase [Acidimicrobiia bacterium]|nr:ATP-dependent 6-phosphofructokinase [Acidimicrobiia bacterium]